MPQKTTKNEVQGNIQGNDHAPSDAQDEAGGLHDSRREKTPGKRKVDKKKKDKKKKD